MSQFWCTLLSLIYLFYPQSCFVRDVSPKEISIYKERVKKMFYHSYEGYLNHAYPYDELRPLTCDGRDVWGSHSLTLIDALDMLIILGNHTEFYRVEKLISDTTRLEKDINVSVFETNIRVVGGLLSAHVLSHRLGTEYLPDGWPCNGPLLSLAEKFARKLLPAFNTATGMPYGTVNLLHGVPEGETTVTCTAGVGTFLIEFGVLSKLTGDSVFEEVALRALDGLWKYKSSINLVGNHIDVQTGRWTALDAGIGSGIDSYFEYLVKGSILFDMPKLMHRFQVHKDALDSTVKKEDWYLWANLNKGTITLPIFQSLESFWPGLLSLIGKIDEAMKTILNYAHVWRQFGFLPEVYDIQKSEATSAAFPLRPEFLESVMYLYRATKDPVLLELGMNAVDSIEHSARTSCGYASVKNVNNHQLENQMESFFLAETIKYLYLLFDQDNFIHNDGRSGKVINTPHGECIIDAGGYIFNTEAHPIDPAVVYCCSSKRMQHDTIIDNFQNNLDILAMMQPRYVPNVFEKEEILKEGEEQVNNRKEYLLSNIEKLLEDTTKEGFVTNLHVLLSFLSENQTETLEREKYKAEHEEVEVCLPDEKEDQEFFEKVRKLRSLERKKLKLLHMNKQMSCPVLPFHMQMSRNGQVFLT